MSQNTDLIKYLNLLSKIVTNSDLSLINKLFNDLKNLFKTEGRLFLAGNGGSAAISNHAEIDISRLTYENNKIETISLVSNIARVTANSNDFGYDNVFTEAISNYKPNKKDLVLIFSSSGKSKNIVNLIKYCNNLDLNTYSLLGFDGGDVKEVSSNSIVFSSDKGYYGPIEDLHMMIIHLFSHTIKEDIKEIV